jgi:quercetin 2,3-dioxygenase
MKIALHKADTRGHVNHGWLDSYHTFSFGGYYNPSRIQFGMLRVLNDDIVAGGAGFGTHPHDNMEIVSIPLSGALEHRDNTGSHGIIKSGEVQIMSAGSGIAHSEFNASKTDKVNFLQIWVLPKVKNTAPRYEQKEFPVDKRMNQLKAVVSPEQNGDALWINQDAWFFLGSLKKGNTVNYTTRRHGNGSYIFVIEGNIHVNEIALNKRDGLGISETDTVTIKADDNAELLLIDVPMN